MIPLELDLCISNKCNLRCRYCYGSEAASGGAHALGEGQIKTAVLQYLRHIRPGDIKKICISGGEPLLDKALLRRTLPWLRKTVGAGTNIACFTNGTLLDPATADFMHEHDVRLKISLDGPAVSQDLNRVTRTGRPTFARVMANLKALGPERVRRLLIYPTINRASVKYLARSTAFLCSLGTGGVRPSFAIQEVWTEKETELLRGELKKIKAHFRGRGRADAALMPRYGYQVMRAGPRRLEDFCLQGELSLGPDGGFYPCGNISASAVPWTPALKARYGLGDIRSGASAQKMRNSRRAAFRAIIAAGQGEYLIEPLYIYYKSLTGAYDLKALLGSSARIARVLLDEDLGEFFPVRK